MTRMAAILLAPVLIFCPLAALGQQAATPAAAPSVELATGLGHLHHSVRTENEKAQKFFDQGMIYVYAFNHAEAVRSFQEAGRLDPHLAMAWWGVALALGPNINLDVDPDSEKAAYEAEQTALALASYGSEEERAYINALAKRYSITPGADLKKQSIDYKSAMGQLVKKYPDDLDAATLYAESAMDLRPWQLWSADGKPAAGTEEIISVLESVLKRDPTHIGANHYYVHALEASPHPERALASAQRLETLVPNAGHLVHMPGHIYARTGDFEKAVVANEKAIDADRKFIAVHGSDSIYAMMYYNHNLDFLASASAMEGNFTKSQKASVDLYASVAPYVDQMAMIEPFLTRSVSNLIRFRRWDQILALKEPPPSHPTELCYVHFARGMAFAARRNLDKAKQEEMALASARKAISADLLFGLNAAQPVIEVATDVLRGEIQLAAGEKAEGLESLRKGVAAQDTLSYDEPPDFFYPVRETLGGALLRSGDAAEAEAVFRADLEKNAKNGRSLFGLEKALEAEKKSTEAARVKSELAEAWSHADMTLSVDDL